jgi:NADH-quinone oxidoreductase subunit G
MADKVTVTIDGVAYEANPGENLLQVCLDRGLLIPHFCYHEALGPAGACRLCAAMIAPAADKPARLDMTCMVRVADGMVVTITDDYSKYFRKSVIEDLMLNHPHDCPVCDEGGECMLQDMTVLSEHVHRRTRFPKRTWENQYLGPLINHEMNRCITCYRCVRFYREYALGDDLGVFGLRDRVYFGRVRDGVLESEFSGNLADVCPTGVFVDKRYRRVYSRPWDLGTARAVCPNCSVGCNVLPGVRHELLRRIKPAQNPAVNKFFICDRGRYGGEFMNASTRLRSARVAARTHDTDEAIEQVATGLRNIAEKHGAGSIAGIGSARASLEANAALGLIVRTLGGAGVTYFTSAAERDTIRRAARITASRQVHCPSLPEIEKADFVLNIGGDLTGEAPMLDLAVRQSIRASNAFFSISPRAGKLEEFARASVRVKPGMEVGVLDRIRTGSSLLDAEASEAPAVIAAALQDAKRPVVLCSALHEDPALVDAAFEFARANSSGERQCGLAYYYPQGNSAGVALMKEDFDPAQLLAAVEAGSIKGLVVLERNAAADFGTDRFTRLAEKCELVVVIDAFANATTAAADVVLPCVTHYESFGTFVNYECRAQRTGAVSMIHPVTLSSSEILLTLAQKLGAGDAIADLDFHDAYAVLPESSAGIDALKPGDAGALVRGSAAPETAPAHVAPAQSALRVYSIIHTFGSEELSSLSPPIAELAPAPGIEMHPDDAAARGYVAGEVTQIREADVKGQLHLNPGIAPGTLGVRRVIVQPATEAVEVTR